MPLMTLQGIRDLLLNIGPPVFHYFDSGQTGNYIVWAEDSEGDSLHADGRKTEQVTQAQSTISQRQNSIPLKSKFKTL